MQSVITIEHSSEAAKKTGYGVNVNFGNPANYVSFVADVNFPAALLVCELVPNTLDDKKWMPSQEEFYIYSHSSVIRQHKTR